MENTCKGKELGSTGVFELPGEPAVIINGVPEALPTDMLTNLCENVTNAEPYQSKGLGEWMEGREIRKFFGEQLFSGTVTEFDKETGWYRVVYEDGDYEDLDWNELEEVLLPLDVNIPLKTLALNVIKKCQKPTKPIHGSGKKVTKSRKGQAMNMGHVKD